MRALLLEPDPAWLEDRRRKGLDKFDEVWDGVLHVVPFPSTAHQRIAGTLYVVLRQLAERHGLEAFEHFGIYHPVQGERNYRGPDVLIVHPQNLSRRGVEGRAELVVEVLSPNDESREKFPFFAQCQIPEVWLLD
ncbi:MAG: Uma2 family endonuclease, partial [Kofleriaceae bacterium]